MTEHLLMRLAGIWEVLGFLLPMIGYGILVGSTWGIIFARRGQRLEAAVVRSLIVAGLPPLLLLFGAGLFAWQDLWLAKEEFSIATSLRSGLVYGGFYGFPLASVSGTTAMIFCCLCYIAFKRCCRLRENVIPKRGTLAAFLSHVHPEGVGDSEMEDLMESAMGDRSPVKNDPWS